MEKNRKISLGLALLPIMTVVIFGLMSVVKWKAGMNMPIMASIIVGCTVGAYLGYSWSEIQQSLVDGVSRALPAIFIIIVIGIIIGSWIQSGIIPVLIYYSLKIISPKIFIPAAAVVTAVIATATGTSFTSIATVGLALMATGLGMGFPGPLLAGAIISGAYFGDSISPLSDTTNLASAMTGCSLFELIPHLMKTGIPALLISLGGFYVLGINHAKSAQMDLQTINMLLEGLDGAFLITPLLLIVPMITIIFSIKKMPALPSLIVVGLLGGLAAILVQGADIGSVIVTMTSGFKSETGVEMVDSLLTRGGLNSMSGTMLTLTLAIALGGVLEKIGALDRILSVIMGKVKSTGSLVLVTVLSGLAVAFATGAQLLAIVIPARMFSDAYEERNLHSKNLARISQSIGTVCINIVPWSVPALFAQNILGVEATKFIPYIFFAYALIGVNLIYGYTGFTMTKIEANQQGES